MPADLFNLRTVERLSRKVKVTNKQKNAAKLWLMNLDAGKLTAERHNYIKFANGVLRDILGYPEREIEESFEKGGVEFLFTNEEEQKVVCFELKGSDQDLFSTQHRVKKEQETPIKQTWDYMGKHNLDYGVTSNFREFVLIDKNKGYSKVHRFKFTSIKSDPSKLKEFIAIFSKKNLIVDTFAEVLYKESIIEERAFTKEFYKLFHETRLMLLKEFIDSGATQERAIHYAQIFLNRLMFVLFAEDTGKLPRRLPEDMILEVLKNRLIINEHSNMVYEAIIGLYRQLDTGAKTPVEIFGFNGELFKEEIPRIFFFNDMREESYFKDVYQQSALKKSKQQDTIESNILSRVGKGISPIISNILLMASFDFTTEVNVNILGHIFEQSITDIEKLQEGEASKRKKEGIYYTPEYITDYICRNTIIPYLSKNNATTTVEELINEHKDNFEVLEKKLKDLRILDPACGSGAFLIKAVDVLLEIHKALIEAKAVQGKYEKRVFGKRGQEERYLSFSKYYDEDEARKIIEDNIHGVDINEESVEITKLSLYLKIAREKKKLLDLSKNIKCGNSLIDDPEVAGGKAFNWEKEFPGISNYGIFDIIIGNPPWGADIEKIDAYLRETKSYSLAEGQYDIYELFIELSISLLKENGIFGFIIPDSILLPEHMSLRKLLINKVSLLKLLKLGEGIFEDVYRAAFILSFVKNQNISQDVLCLVANKDDRKKLREGSATLGVICSQKGHFLQQTHFKGKRNVAFDINISEEDLKIIGRVVSDPIDWDDLFTTGRGVELSKSGEVMLCPYCLKWDNIPVKSKGKFTPKKCTHCSKVYNYDEAAEHNLIIKDKKNGDEWKPILTGESVNRYYNVYGLFIDTTKEGINYKKNELYVGKKILIRKTGVGIYASIDNQDALTNQVVFIYKLKPTAISQGYKPEYFLGVINSRLMLYYYFTKFADTEWKSFPYLTQKVIQTLPVKKIDFKNHVEKNIHDDISDLVYIATNENKHITLEIDAKIERLVMKLYNISNKECDKIMKSFDKVQELRIMREIKVSNPSIFHPSR